MHRCFTYILLCSLLFSHATPGFAETWQWMTPSKGASNPVVQMTEEENISNISLSTPTSNPGIILSEVFPNPKGTDTGKEWIELYNTTTESISLGNLFLQNTRKQQFSLAYLGEIPAQSYLQISLPTTFTLANTKDTVELYHTEIPEPWDYISYAHMVEDRSISKFCPTATSCFTETSTPSPKHTNIAIPLQITASHDSAVFHRGFSLKLTPSHPEMKVFYTTDATSVSPEDGIAYTTPIRIEQATTIRYVGVVNEQSTPIYTKTFGTQTPANTSLFVSEITKEMIEVESTSAQTIILGSTSPCLEDCQEILVPQGRSTISLEENTHTTIYIHNPDGTLLTQVTPSATHSLSLPPTNTLLLQRNVAYGSLATATQELQPTLLATPNTDNLFLFPHSLELDSDRDGLTNKEEQLLGTDPHHADTDGDGLPDGFEVKYGLSPLTPSQNELFHIYQKLYRQELGRFVHINSDGNSLQGVSIPNMEIHAIAPTTGETLQKTISDAFGAFTITLPVNSPATHIIIKDQQGNASSPIPISRKTYVGTANQDTDDISFLLTAMPNPTGKDSSQTEWITLTSQSEHTTQFRGYSIQHGEHTYTLPDITLQPGELLLLRGVELGFTLQNTSGSIQLRHNGNTIEELTYTSAKEGEIYDSSLHIRTESASQPIISAIDALSSINTIPTYTPLSFLSLPEQDAPHMWAYQTTAPAQMQWWSIIVGMLGIICYIFTKESIQHAWQYLQAYRSHHRFTHISA